MATLKIDIFWTNQILQYSMFREHLNEVLYTDVHKKKLMDGGISKILFLDIFNYQYLEGFF